MARNNALPEYPFHRAGAPMLLRWFQEGESAPGAILLYSMLRDRTTAEKELHAHAPK